FSKHALSRIDASCEWGTPSSTLRSSSTEDGSRPLPWASRRRACSNRLWAPIGDWILPPHLFGERPNRATGTARPPQCYGGRIALPFSDCIVPAWLLVARWRRASGLP